MFKVLKYHRGSTFTQANYMIKRNLLFPFKNIIFLIFIYLIPQTSYSEEPSLLSEYIRVIKTFKTEKAIFSSPVATWNDNVIVGSHDKNIYFFTKDGKLITKFQTQGWVHASPSMLSDSSIAIGSYDGFIYFFNENGELQNKIKPGSGSLFTSIVELPNRLLVFGTNKKGIIFLNKEDSTSHIYPIRKWVHGTPNIIDNDKLVIGSNDKHLYIFDKNAKLLSKIKTNGWIMHSAPTPLNQNSFAVGSYDKNLYICNTEGNTVSSFKTKGRIHSTPLKLKDSKIVFGSFDRFIYFLKPDGTLYKKFKTRKKVVSSPICLADGTIIVGSYDKHLYFFSPQGVLLGKYKTKGKIFATPIVLDNNTIVVCSTNGYIEFLKVKPMFALSE